MTAAPWPAEATTAEPSFRSADATLRFERRALSAIRHAARCGLFTVHEAAGLVDRVRAVTAETLALLTAGTEDSEGCDG
ncbi:hypothetical protein [Sciscionella marina]|uniref:hypothetical protein n=1 Tax=Sciscionella marina TaxID=508770 RepID=UPI00035F2F19|nr:hypothetical protein [Sciscionella marina]